MMDDAFVSVFMCRKAASFFCQMAAPLRPRPGRMKAVEPTPAQVGPRTAAPATPGEEEIIMWGLKVGPDGVTCVDPALAPTFKPPHVVLDDLEKERDLDRGAHGNVALYHRIADPSERYAIKHIDVHDKKQALTIVASEVGSVFEDPSPYTVRLFNCHLRRGTLYLIMEYMNARSLADLLQFQPRLAENIAAYITGHVLRALDRLHSKRHIGPAGAGDALPGGKTSRHVVHRDIKPANILMNTRGEVKLADFGVAGNADSIGLATFVGTVTYMSPERLQGRTYDSPADLWSVGVVVAEMLLGYHPFGAVRGAPPSTFDMMKRMMSAEGLKLGPSVSPEAQDFVDQCLRNAPEARPTAKDLCAHPWILRYCKMTSRRSLEADAPPPPPAPPTIVKAVTFVEYLQAHMRRRTPATSAGPSADPQAAAAAAAAATPTATLAPHHHTRASSLAEPLSTRGESDFVVEDSS
jgi:serine/threonine protein kinase